MRFLSRTLLALALVACGSRNDDSAESTAGRLPSREVCAERTAAMETRLLELAERERDDRARFSRIVLPRAAPNEADEAGEAIAPPFMSIRIGPDTVWLDGREVSRDQLRSDVETTRRNWSVLRPGRSPVSFVYVGAPAALSAARLSQVLRWLPDRLSAWLIVAIPIDAADPVAPDASAALRGRVAALPSDQYERFDAISALFDFEASGCEPLLGLSDELAWIDATEKGRFMAEYAPRAARECGCRGIDLAAMETSLGLTILGSVPHDSRRRALELPDLYDWLIYRGDATVQQLADALVAGEVAAD